MTNTPSPCRPWRVAAMSGAIFSSLFFFSLLLIRIAVPADPTEPGVWIASDGIRRWVRFALNLVPFTGISFLWFMAVLRDRIGDREDRLFATVFLGSGLLFVAMLFVASALAQSLLDTFSVDGRLPAMSETYAVGRRMGYTLMNILAVKMAAVFILATSRIGLRTAIFPRWMAFLGQACAIVMLLVIAEFAWIALVFPAWVLLISIHLLVMEGGGAGGNRVVG